MIDGCGDCEWIDQVEGMAGGWSIRGLNCIVFSGVDWDMAVLDRRVHFRRLRPEGVTFSTKKIPILTNLFNWIFNLTHFHLNINILTIFWRENWEFRVRTSKSGHIFTLKPKFWRFLTYNWHFRVWEHQNWDKFSPINWNFDNFWREIREFRL